MGLKNKHLDHFNYSLKQMCRIYTVAMIQDTSTPFRATGSEYQLTIFFLTHLTAGQISVAPHGTPTTSCT